MVVDEFVQKVASSVDQGAATSVWAPWLPNGKVKGKSILLTELKLNPVLMTGIFSSCHIQLILITRKKKPDCGKIQQPLLV